MLHVVFSLTPEGYCAQHCFSLRSIAWSDRVKDKTQCVLTRIRHLLAFTISQRFCASCPDGLQSCFCPSLFCQSPHSVSITVTGTLTTHQATPIAWQAAFWVVRIPFLRLDSYQSQRAWTTGNFQPRAKYMCDWIRETGCLWRLLDFGRFPPFVWRIFHFTLAALSPVCLAV